MTFNEYKLSDLCDVQIGRTPPRNEHDWFNPACGGWKWASIKDLGLCNKHLSETSETISKEAQAKFNIPVVKAGTLLLSFKLTIGRLAFATEDMLTNEAIAQLPMKRPDLLDKDFLYYYLRKYPWDKLGNTSSIATAVNSKTIKDMRVSLPPLSIQRKISSILKTLDEKINANSEINDNLEQQVRALYRQIFVDSSDCIASVCRADEFFDISIGKTPPRKEQQWFTTNPNDITWVSISDMGSCGTFISNSSEQLTAEAVEKFNVKVVPANTVLLSFKLTVGRIAITDGEMTTNEAIAHFKTDNLEINEYLYCYLKDFNYQTMGSTSSIATAVNSKIVKAMPFCVPTDEALERFHGIAYPMFSQIRTNQAENRRLADIRDSLLPRLMSGELDVSQIDL